MNDNELDDTHEKINLLNEIGCEVTFRNHQLFIDKCPFDALEQAIDICLSDFLTKKGFTIQRNYSGDTMYIGIGLLEPMTYDTKTENERIGALYSAYRAYKSLNNL